MDWKDVAAVVAPLAPKVGNLLGGFIPFPGGSLVGELAGKALGGFIAAQFGVPDTPDAVHAAITGNPNDVVIAKLNAAADEAKAKWAAGTETEKAWAHALETGLAQVNETMRAELAHEHWFFTGWRPAIGWVFAFIAACFGVMLTFAGAIATWRSPDALKTLNDAWPLFAAYFGVIGLVVGVYIPSRSIEKRAAIESGAPMPNAAPKPPVKK